MTAFLPWLWQATLVGSGAILLTLILMPPLRRFLGARAAFPAWGFALILLVSPWLVRSPVSVLPPASDLPPVVVQVVIPATISTPGLSSATPERSAIPWPLVVWAAGAAGCLAISLLQVLQTHRLVRRGHCVTSKVQSALDALGGLPPRSQVHESSEIHSPAMCGVFRPVILLPAGWSRDQNLPWILLHEIGHIQRGDLLWRWAFQLVRALHWFNPLVWIAERAARIDQEMACDEWVLARKGTQERTVYGEAILRAASQSQSRWSIRAGMAESNSGLARRIRHLATAHPRGFLATALMFVLGCTVALLLSPAPNADNASLSPLPALPQKTLSAGPPTQIEIESQFIEVSPEIAEEVFGTGNSEGQTILAEKEFFALLYRLGQKQGVDLLTAPKVTTKSGRKAIVRIVRDFPYATEYAPPGIQRPKPGENFEPYLTPTTPMAFETRSVGITLEVDPHFSADNRIICQLSPMVVEFLGFVNYGSGAPSPSNPNDDAMDAALQPVANTTEVINQPIFRTREMQTTVALRSGQTVMLGGLSRTDRQAEAASSGFPAGFPPAPGTKDVERVLFVFVTLRAMDAKGITTSAIVSGVAAQPLSAKPFATPTPNTTPIPLPLLPDAQKNHPYGTPVPNKPGFVTSPHAPYAGYVDLRGFAPGTEVKCPYTGKLFLAP